MVERNTRIRYSQISSVRPDDLDSTNALGSGIDNYIPSYDEATGKFTWVENTAGVSTLEGLTDVEFDSGTPTDGQVLTYDSGSGKWKAEDASGGASQLSDLSDVGDTTPTNKNVLVADGDSWESRALVETDISNLGSYLENLLEDTTPQLGGDLDLNGHNIDFPSVANISDVLDEDDMSSDSATKLATQQSIKAYADGIYDILLDNIALNAFRIAINGSLTQFLMEDGVVDEYEDESGIDTGNSSNQSYDSSGDYYESTESGGLPSSEYASDSYTKLLLHCNGSDESTTFTDSGNTGHTVTANGDAQIDTAQKKFGTASGLFDGTGDYLTVPDHADWDFGTGDFTIDLWVRFNDLTTAQFFVGQYADATHRWYVGKAGSSDDNKLIIYFAHESVKAYYKMTNAWSGCAINTWYHLAFVRNGTTGLIFIDGISQTLTGNTVFNINDTGDYASILYIGDWGIGTQYVNGWMDEVRISKGIARWTEDFDSATTDNMTLISENTEAETQPDESRIVILEEDVDAVTINTDLKAYVSRDDGSNWSEVTLSDEGDFDGSKRILVGNVDISGQPSDKTMVYKLVTANNKDLKIHGTAMFWS